jgi:hypothetical protein
MALRYNAKVSEWFWLWPINHAVHAADAIHAIHHWRQLYAQWWQRKFKKPFRKEISCDWRKLTMTPLKAVDDSLEVKISCVLHRERDQVIDEAVCQMTHKMNNLFNFFISEFIMYLAVTVTMIHGAISSFISQQIRVQFEHQHTQISSFPNIFCYVSCSDLDLPWWIKWMWFSLHWYSTWVCCRFFF